LSVREADTQTKGNDMADEQLPTTRAVRAARGYALYPDGSLWRRGAYPYRAGYVMDPANFDAAVDAAEEEARVLLAQAREEFGF